MSIEKADDDDIVEAAQFLFELNVNELQHDVIDMDEDVGVISHHEIVVDDDSVSMDYRNDDADDDSNMLHLHVGGESEFMDSDDTLII
jgi:hypothetical protein